MHSQLNTGLNSVMWVSSATRRYIEKWPSSGGFKLGISSSPLSCSDHSGTASQCHPSHTYNNYIHSVHTHLTIMSLQWSSRLTIVTNYLDLLKRVTITTNPTGLSFHLHRFSWASSAYQQHYSKPWEERFCCSIIAIFCSLDLNTTFFFLNI